MEPEPKRRRKMVASDSSSSDSESASESSSSATPPKELQPVKEEQEEEVDPALMEEFPEDDHEETDEQKEQRQLQIVRAAQLRRNHLMYLLSDIPERHLFGLIRGSFVLIKTAENNVALALVMDVKRCAAYECRHPKHFKEVKELVLQLRCTRGGSAKFIKASAISSGNIEAAHLKEWSKVMHRCRWDPDIFLTSHQDRFERVSKIKFEEYTKEVVEQILAEERTREYEANKQMIEARKFVMERIGQKRDDDNASKHALEHEEREEKSNSSERRACGPVSALDTSLTHVEELEEMKRERLAREAHAKQAEQASQAKLAEGKEMELAEGNEMELAKGKRMETEELKDSKDVGKAELDDIGKAHADEIQKAKQDAAMAGQTETAHDVLREPDLLEQDPESDGEDHEPQGKGMEFAEDKGMELAEGKGTELAEDLAEGKGMELGEGKAMEPEELKDSKNVGKAELHEIGKTHADETQKAEKDTAMAHEEQPAKRRRLQRKQPAPPEYLPVASRKETDHDARREPVLSKTPNSKAKTVSQGPKANAKGKGAGGPKANAKAKGAGGPKANAKGKGAGGPKANAKAKGAGGPKANAKASRRARS